MASLATILSQHPELKLLGNNRIKCEVTGHEIPPSVTAVSSHLNGKKYKKALEWYNKDFSNYLPYIVPHKSDTTKLFCNVTKQDLNKIPSQVEKHVSGKRFCRLKEQFEASQKKKIAPKRKIAEESVKDEDSEECDFWAPDGFDDEEMDDIEESGEQEEASNFGDDSSEEQEVDKTRKSSSKSKASKKRKADHIVVVRKDGKGKRAKRNLEEIA